MSEKTIESAKQVLTIDETSFLGWYFLGCGSIAHYNKQGWICEYPDIPAIRNFFIRNEYGKSILEWQPWWATDRIEIIKKIYNLFNIKQELT